MLLLAGVIAVLVIARRDPPAPPPAREAALTHPDPAQVKSSTHRATPQPALPAPVLAPAPTSHAIAIEIEGASHGTLDSSELAARPTTLQASNRRAWRLRELIESPHIHANAVTHALTIDGGDYILNGDGRAGSGDPILVRRNTGELYIGWLDGDNPHLPLADAERPAERIENLARISIATPVAVPEPPPASLAVVIDGKRRQTLTAQSFAAAAKIQIQGQHDGPAPAIDIAHAFGNAVQVVSVTAGGARVTTAPPTPDARAVIYMNRRARFKFAWIDPAGNPLGHSKQRDISELVLKTGPQLATRR